MPTRFLRAIPPMSKSARNSDMSALLSASMRTKKADEIQSGTRECCAEQRERQCPSADPEVRAIIARRWRPVVSRWTVTVHRSAYTRRCTLGSSDQTRHRLSVVEDDLRAATVVRERD